MNSLNIKIPTTFEFITSKLKMKMIFKLLEFYKQQKNEEILNSNKFGYGGTLKSNINLVLEKIHTYITNDLTGFTELPFIKVLCFYWRVCSQYGLAT
jgi:hypothetical protein